MIKDWGVIRDNFTDGLVLGNGASIAVNEEFSYSSLWTYAKEVSAVGRDVQKIFDFLETADFEFVLRVLWHAKMVNSALGLSERRTLEAYEKLRNALIAVVRKIHPPYANVAEALGRGLTFISQFKTVVSLNYDLLLYWTILRGNRREPNRYKDCFVYGKFQHDWCRLRKPYGNALEATLVFYPHGSLAFGSDEAGAERKITSNQSGRLLDTVLQQWRNDKLTPLFVSEGTSTQKLAAIHRSPYLSTVYEEVLPNLGESLVLFGWSISDQDNHVLNAICRSSPKRIAVSVGRSSARRKDMIDRTKRKLNKLLRRNTYELVFFDRESSGAWVA
jgi:Domain of unknown function (DUF4917)